MSDLIITISKDKKILNKHLKHSKLLVTRKWQIYNSFFSTVITRTVDYRFFNFIKL